MTKPADYWRASMRILTALLLAAAPLLAGGILVPTGKNLGEFKVLLDLKKVDRSSPEALARTWAFAYSASRWFAVASSRRPTRPSNER